MLLGIEIGGTKLQLGIGDGDGSALRVLERIPVSPDDGAEGILRDIERVSSEILKRHPCRAVGIGFGGPVDAKSGCVIKSHQVSGWDGFALAEWGRQTFGVPTRVENDAETAGLAEALFGAGKGASPVLYVTVGSGIGGGLVVDGEIYQGFGHGASEIGHLRPSFAHGAPSETVEAIASGWGIARRAREKLAGRSDDEATALLALADGQVEDLSTEIIAKAADTGNAIAGEILAEAEICLGWAIAQTITLVAPEMVVVGGGVSLIGEALFFEPLRQIVAGYVFPPFLGRYRIRAAALGEEVVVHGALALAETAS